MSPQIRFFFARLFPVPFILIGVVALYYGGRSLLRAYASPTWPAAEGQIQHSTVTFNRGGRSGGTYHADVRYSFLIAEQVRHGNTIAFGDYGSSDPSHAQGLVNRYPRNAAVSVRYLPTDPNVCVLEPGLTVQTLFVPGFGLIFLVAGTIAIFLQRK